MKSAICQLLGIEFPIIAFSHCRDVVCEVSKAGGMGVLGAARYSPAQLEVELEWIDNHIGGKPYGVDVIAPVATAVGDDDRLTPHEMFTMVPEEHKDFVRKVLEQHSIDASDVYEDLQFQVGGSIGASRFGDVLDIAFSHPIGLIANALGVPQPRMFELAGKSEVPVAALVGAREHAIRHLEAGVDILVAAGSEAGGHCGEVSTMVLVPEVVEAVKSFGNIPVLAAGGIVTGRQMAACMAMGADGVWTGSVWLTTSEAETSRVVKEKLLAATSRQTVRSRSRTGKFSRQLQTPWTDAWEHAEAPEPLPRPLQSLVVEPPLRKLSKLADGGHEGARALTTYWVGQGVGLMNSSRSTRAVIQEFMEDYLAAAERLQGFIGDGF